MPSAPHEPALPLRWHNLRRVEIVVLALGVVALAASIVVATITRPEPVKPLELDGAKIQARIKVNIASAANLTIIPGIGEKTAQAIVDNRAARGPFASFDDLCARVRVNEKRLENFERYLDFTP